MLNQYSVDLCGECSPGFVVFNNSPRNGFIDQRLKIGLKIVTNQVRQYFNGTLDAHGIFTDRSGKVVKRFTVVMQCTWEGDNGVLDEDFTYADGTKQRRIWRLKALPDGRYEGRADDVIGGAQGHAAGNALNWRYTLALQVDGSVYEVQFDDWMYLMNDKVMLNKAQMRKFGIYLGEVTLAFTKR